MARGSGESAASSSLLFGTRKVQKAIEAAELQDLKQNMKIQFKRSFRPLDSKTASVLEGLMDDLETTFARSGSGFVMENQANNLTMWLTVDGLLHRDNAAAVVFESDSSPISFIEDSDIPEPEPEPEPEDDFDSAFISYNKMFNLILDAKRPIQVPDPVKAELWFSYGNLHRESGPAMVFGQDQQWHKHGKLHRLGGPAWITADEQAFYRQGYLHREDGPALVSAEQHFLRGEFLTPAVFQEKTVNSQGKTL